MDIEITCRNFSSTVPICEHVYYELARVLVWNRREVLRVRVTLEDIGGLQDGVDKYCRIVVCLTEGVQLRIGHSGRDLYTAVSDAVVRMERVIVEEFSQRRASLPRRSLATMWG